VQFAAGSTSPTSGHESQGDTDEGSGQDPGEWAGAGAPGRVVSREAEEARQEEKAWIEVEVVDQDGVPWDASDYKLELPDFSLQEGKLDGKGRVRREQLIPGLARLWLPDPDAYDFALGSTSPANEEKAWIEVELTDDAGRPLAGRKVKIELPDGTLIDDALDERGRLRRDDIKPGRAKIHLVEPDAAPPPRVGPPEEIAAEKKAWLDVVLTDDDGRPLAGRKVKIELPDGTLVDDQLDADGRLRRDDLQPGTAKLHLDEEDAAAAAALAAATAPEPDRTAWLDVQLTDDAGTPLAGAPVKIELPDGTLLDDKLDDAGRLARRDLAPGEAKLHLVEEDAAAPAAFAAAAAAAVPEEKAWLEVQLTDDGGVPLAGHPVKLELPDGTLIDDKLADAGRLARTHLAPGEAKLHLVEEDAAAPAAFAAATAAAAPETKAWLEVQLTDDTGWPLAGLPVKLELPDGTIIDEKLDEDGRLARKDIPAGQAKLHLPEE
jgi:protocatechuate 3,4-dioxygenase beta subunit